MAKKKAYDFTEAQISAMMKMGVCPAYKLTDKELSVLEILEGKEDFDFIDLILTADLKPSKALKIIDELSEMDFIEYDDDLTSVKITDLGTARINYEYMDKKAKKKLMKLVTSLSEEELSEFEGLCEQVEVESAESCCCEEASEECCCEAQSEENCCCEASASETYCCGAPAEECGCDEAPAEECCCTEEAPAEECCCTEETPAEECCCR